MLGGIGHALVSAVEEAVFFTIARNSQTQFEIKGKSFNRKLFGLASQSIRGCRGTPHCPKEHALDSAAEFDTVIIAGLAKSHCVAWTDDLLTDIQLIDANLANKVYLLKDCTSPVVVPGLVDYTQKMLPERFAAAAGGTPSQILRTNQQLA